MYENKLEFPGGKGGGGVQNKKPSMVPGEYGYFLELHNIHNQKFSDGKMLRQKFSHILLDRKVVQKWHKLKRLCSK